MTATKESVKPKDLALKFNRFAYGAFVALGFYFLLASKDISTSMSNFGIALIFDPFDQNVMWNNRPKFQRVWLIVHASVVIGLLAYCLITSFSK